MLFVDFNLNLERFDFQLNFGSRACENEQGSESRERGAGGKKLRVTTTSYLQNMGWRLEEDSRGLEETRRGIEGTRGGLGGLEGD